MANSDLPRHGRELALLLLTKGSITVQSASRLASQILVAVFNRLTQYLLARSPSIAQLRAVLRQLISFLGQQLLHVVQSCGRLLAQLLSVHVQLVTHGSSAHNDELSAQLHTCLALFFGTLRLRSLTQVQLAMPQKYWTQQAPHLALITHSTSSSGTCSPQQHGTNSSSKHQAAIWQSQDLLLSTSEGCLKCSQPCNPSNGTAKQQRAGATAAEVHVLCSTELRTAIVHFLQHHSSSQGQEFVLLRNTSSMSRSDMQLGLRSGHVLNASITSLKSLRTAPWNDLVSPMSSLSSLHAGHALSADSMPVLAAVDAQPGKQATSLRRLSAAAPLRVSSSATASATQLAQSDQCLRPLLSFNPQHRSRNSWLFAPSSDAGMGVATVQQAAGCGTSMPVCQQPQQQWQQCSNQHASGLPHQQQQRCSSAGGSAPRCTVDVHSVPLIHSGGPIGTPACHSSTCFSPKKKATKQLPPAPFSLTADPLVIH